MIDEKADGDTEVTIGVIDTSPDYDFGYPFRGRPLVLHFTKYPFRGRPLILHFTKSSQAVILPACHAKHA